MRNTDAIARTLGPALRRAINNRLEVVREEKKKNKEMKERQNAEALAV